MEMGCVQEVLDVTVPDMSKTVAEIDSGVAAIVRFA
jgi:hypothetical protein